MGQFKKNWVINRGLARYVQKIYVENTQLVSKFAGMSKKG
jgi:hypothetical protein